MIEAIRRDPGVTMKDDAIIDVMVDAIDEEWEPSACLERLHMRGS